MKYNLSNMDNSHLYHFILSSIIILFLSCTPGENLSQSTVKLIDVENGWAKNSINTVIFRKNSLVTYENMQYCAFYDNDSYLTIAKRQLYQEDWIVKHTSYKGNTADAHNSISIMVDGDGYLHVAFDHHNTSLKYCRSVEPGALDLTDLMPMTGIAEESVSYPEFYKEPDGDLLFFYRDGGSGRGNLVINKYDTKKQTWSQLYDNLISGEYQRNAYWQACIGADGTIHISWVWRESPDVASNHDLCYARSKDGGVTWEKSNGETYTLPITASSAEMAWEIPQNSELINQTSMTVNESGDPFIATYWRSQDSDVPQFRLVYHNGKEWKMQDLAFRKEPFSLSGGGTKRIPISRPQIMVSGKRGNESAYMIFRDEERENKASMAICDTIKKEVWTIKDLSSENLGAWEPAFDTELWRDKKTLNLFIQKVVQIDGEGLAQTPPQMVKVLEWDSSE